MKIPFISGDILLPKNTNMSLWSVIACDQYTSNKSYWDDVNSLVQDNKSTLRLTLPELYLEEENVGEKINKINQTMQQYVDTDTFVTYPNTMFYIERTQSDGRIREGLIGLIDLEAYSYEIGSTTMVRATEKTVIERIPPRVKVRENALLELPHIMILIDDEKKQIIENLKHQVNENDKVYDFDLMKNGGHIKGYSLNQETINTITKGLEDLCEQEYFNKKYKVEDKSILLFAMGDGNHSLATAKTCYENLKKTMSEEEYLNNPARYALVELVNLHSEALEFEAIHRVIFNTNVEELFNQLEKYYDISYEECDGQKVEYVSKEKSGVFYIKNPKSNITVGSLQMFLDEFLKNNPGKIDYIHGDQETRNLGSEENNIGFLLPTMKKEELFRTVILDGALPRKTFSMGHADDKRFYLEARRIK